MMTGTRSVAVVLGFAGVLALSAVAWGQASRPSVFVANNGNCEGSVSSFILNPDGTVILVQKVVTGSVPCGSGQWHPGLNAQSIDISPSGKYLLTGHGTISSTTEQLTFFQVNPDSTFSILFTAMTQDSPVTVRWIDDEYIAVTSTPSGSHFVLVYRVNFAAQSITLHAYGAVSSIFDFVIDHKNSLLFARDGASGVSVFRINANRTLTRLNANAYPAGVFFLGPGLSPDGTKLYYGGGIASSNGLSSRWIGGFNVNPATGQLTQMPNSPFLSPPADGTSGPSPKQVVVASDNRHAIVSHGTTAHLRGFEINQSTGELTPVPDSYFDVGGQGDCGNMIVMGDRLFVTRRYSSTTHGNAGLISLTINNDGTLTANGPSVPTNGSLPWDIAVWPGLASCPADIAPPGGDGVVNVNDLIAVINGWGACPTPCPPSCVADITKDCTVNVNDLIAIINAWGPCR